MPPILKAFCNSYPGIELHMETGLTSGMIGRIGKAFDVVIAMHARGEKSGELLRRERAVWAGSPELDVRNLDPLPVALYPNGCLFRDWTIAALDRSERRWRIAFISHSHGAVEAIVAQGLAVTVVKEGTFPRSLRMLGTEDGLPALPTAEIRLHRIADSAASSHPHWLSICVITSRRITDGRRRHRRTTVPTPTDPAGGARSSAASRPATCRRSCPRATAPECRRGGHRAAAW